jgi:hypothetical protein
MMTVIGVLVVIALICTIVSAAGKLPLWIPVFVLCTIELLRILPVGK